MMMNEFISIAILLFEVLMVLQCLQVAFKQEIHFDKYTIGIIFIDISLYMLINLKILPAPCSIVLYVLLFIYCYIEFKQKIAKTIIRFVVGFVLVGCIESIVAFVTNVCGGESNSIYILLLSSIIALVIACFMKRNVILLKFRKTTKYNRDMYGIVILLGASMIVLLMDYYLIQKPMSVYGIFVLVSLILILFYLYRLVLAQNEIEKKNYELEVQRIYGGAYENLITDVRRRQHDFKNQLGVIYSMHLVAKSMDELVYMQKEYGNTIQKNCKFDSILTSCNNPILAGYLYHRCLSCEQSDVSVDYNIHIEQANCCFQLYELIEMLGILLDNACESLALQQRKHKQIKLEFVEDENVITICVSNPSRYITYSEIEKMFVKGFSTKGENRGIGLTRVLELTKKYDVELKVSNTVKDADNWIEFAVRIIK
ncbi:MAG: GHKL domain-containing protein [Lachnospiraceae bacterium]|nr:GHKL domain-containing protein [Lachnospiraceae bacterium]